MGLTGFNRLRREAEAKKKTVSPQPKVVETTVEKVSEKTDKVQTTVKKNTEKKVVENVHRKVD